MRPSRMESGSDRRGFTLVELAIVVTIASIMIGFALPRIQSTFHKRDVNGARNGVMLLAARARARATEQAKTVEFRLYADDAYAEMVEDGATVETFRFGDELGVAARSSAGDIVLCYTARGYATEPCSTSLGSPARVVFARVGETAEIEVWPLGQLRKP